MNKELTPKMKQIKEQIDNISNIKTLSDRTKTITKIKKNIHSERLLLEEYLESLEKIMHQVENPPDQNQDFEPDNNQDTEQEKKDKPDLESSESSESTNSTESSESSGSSKESKVSKESGYTVLSVKEKTMDVHSLASDIQKLKEQLDNTRDVSDRIELFDIIIKKTRKCQEYYHNIKMEVIPVGRM